MENLIKNSFTRQISISAFFSLSVVAFILGVSIQIKIENAALVVDQEKEEGNLVDNLFGNLPLMAKAVAVFDLENNRAIFLKNGYEQVPLASLTKIMSALVVANELPMNLSMALNQEEVDKIISENVENLDVLYLKEKKWQIVDILKMSMAASLNGSISALAAETLRPKKAAGLPDDRGGFTVKMNEEARALGLDSFYFFNETGLDLSEEISGGYGSAIDVAILFGYVAKKYPDIFSATRKNKTMFSDLDGGAQMLDNTNPNVEMISGLIASKTGLTDLAGGNLAAIVDVDLNHPIALVVLGSNETRRFTDMERLIKTTKNYFYVKNIIQAHL